MSERARHNPEPSTSEVVSRAREVRASRFHDAERTILEGYDGAVAIEKELILREMLTRMYIEGYLDGTETLRHGEGTVHTEIITISDNKLEFEGEE